VQAQSSISRKLTWLNIFVSGAALVITATALLIYDQSSYRRILMENLSAQADVVGKNSVSALIFADPESATNTLSALESVPNVLAASLFSAGGELFASYSTRPELSVTKLSGVARSSESESAKDRQMLMTRVLRSGDRTVGYLVIRADTSGIHARLIRYLLIVGALLVLSLFAAVGLSTVFRSAVTQPIVQLAKTARLVSSNRDYSIRVPKGQTRDELSVLIDAFNEMLSGIQSRDAALNSERARLRAILDNAPVGILVADSLSGKTVLANKTVDQILQEPVVSSGKAHSDWRIMWPAREPVADTDRPLNRALRGETVIGEDYIVVRRDGSEKWVRASAAPIREKTGEVVAGLVVFIDIDNQKKAQEALLQSEKLAAAGRLAASISHEINNPLESVTNLLFIVLSDQTIAENTRTLLTQADQELARVTHIATQTLRFYRQSTNPKSVDMGNVVDSVLQLLSAKIRNTNVQIERQYCAGHQITCFEGEMRQVFTNLICNALDAAPGKEAWLRIRTKRVLASSKGKAGIQVTIADNGHGISADLARRIFEPFYTTKGSLGTGLGLWVTQEIVTKHSGSIRVRSKPGRGTVFVVHIPFKGTAERKQVAA